MQRVIEGDKIMYDEKICPISTNYLVTAQL